jgi:putative transposase
MTKHTPEQILLKLRAAEVDLASGLTIGPVGPKLAIREQTFHRWRQHYGGMKADDAQRLTELELENERLKCLVAQRALDKHRRQGVVQKKFGPPPLDGRPRTSSRSRSASRSGGPAASWGNTARRSGNAPGPRRRSSGW